MAVKYKNIGFPSELTCPCGAKQLIRKLIIHAVKQKEIIDEEFFPNHYFSSYTCRQCNEYIWYILLDHSNDLREIELLTDNAMQIKAEDEEWSRLFEDTKKLYEQLQQIYQIELVFPARLMVTTYLEPHEISKIKDEIYTILPMIVFNHRATLSQPDQPEQPDQIKKQKQTENQKTTLAIPYQHNGKIYGDLKVNYDLSSEDREQFKDFCFGIWDLLYAHYFGSLREINWSIDELLE